MGKIRVAKFDESGEEIKAKKAVKKVVKETQETEETQGTEETKEKKVRKARMAKKEGKVAKVERSKNYVTAKAKIDKSKKYTLKDALALLPTVGLAKFDESVELHLNMVEAGVSATLTLPHGTGKQIRVAVADDSVIAQIEKGKIDFDILLATPSMMPKLAKAAKILGPKGLMPNPKNGTIGTDTAELAKKFQGGQITFKTESKLPVMHTIVGKVSFGSDKLTDNIKALIKVINSEKVKKATLKSTMSPAIRLDLATL